jgi:hypothetical protein
VVVFQSSLEGLLCVLDGGGQIASDLCQCRPVHRYLPWNPTQLPLIFASGSPRRGDPSLRVVQAVLDAGQLSAR